MRLGYPAKGSKSYGVSLRAKFLCGAGHGCHQVSAGTQSSKTNNWVPGFLQLFSPGSCVIRTLVAAKLEVQKSETPPTFYLPLCPGPLMHAVTLGNPYAQATVRTA